ESIKESLQKAEALRQSILKKAFEGRLLTEKELKVCKQEPDWEPAEVLLERIKASKGKSNEQSD
ncbi:MAG: restriction endonuclease, partial [Desulfamplus sp.]|nr:restriction endonuclease [Desulfamplus sp.]